MGTGLRLKRRFFTALGFIYTDPETIDVLIDEVGQIADLLPVGKHTPKYGRQKVMSIRVAPRGVKDSFHGKSKDGFNFEVKAQVGFIFNPLTIEELDKRQNALYRCLENREWPQVIVNMLFKDAIKKSLGAYQAKDLISGDTIVDVEKNVRHNLQTSLFPGFSLLRVQVNALLPPRELTEAMESGRRISIVVGEALSHMSTDDDSLSALLKVARAMNLLDGYSDTTFHHIEYGDSAKPEKHVTVLPPSGGRSRRSNLHPRNNQSRGIVEN